MRRKIDRRGLTSGARSYEGRMLERMDDGDSFITAKEPQQMHVLANYYNRHITTERIALFDSEMNVTKCIKVTIEDTKGREYERLDRVVRKYERAK